jgi:hypothetical protein
LISTAATAARNGWFDQHSSNTANSCTQLLFFFSVPPTAAGLRGKASTAAGVVVTAQHACMHENSDPLPEQKPTGRG